jgi:hypothetical protein
MKFTLITYVEMISALLKIYCFLSLIYFLGLLKGLILIILYIMGSDWILKRVGLERLTTTDLLLLGKEVIERFNCCCIFYIENEFKAEEIKAMLVKGLSLHKKMNKKLIQILYLNFWQDIPQEEIQKGVRIVNQVFSSKDELINYAKSEADNHVNIFDGLPYDFQVLKCEKGGAVFFKVDHSLSDGLGMNLFTATLSDGYCLDYLPTLLKCNKRENFVVNFLRNFCTLLVFPYYSAKVMINNQSMVSEPNPLSRKGENNGDTEIVFSDVFDFTKLHAISKGLNITFNDLCLAVIGAAFNKYSLQFPERNYNYKKLVCAIPVGLKNPPTCVQEVQVSNDITGTLISLKRITDPLKEYKAITEETKKLKNAYMLYSLRYFSFIMDEFLPLSVSKKVCQTLSTNIDLAISNLPGPAKQISYLNNPITDIIPMISIGFNKCFIIIGTYNNRLRLSITLDKGLKLDKDKLVEAINNEFENIIINYKNN